MLVKKVRNWFSTIDTTYNYPSANVILVAYNQFYDDIVSTLSKNGFTEKEIEEMPVSDFIKFTKDWVKV